MSKSFPLALPLVLISIASRQCSRNLAVDFRNVTPQVAQNNSGRRRSAIDARTTSRPQPSALTPPSLREGGWGGERAATAHPVA